MYSTNFSFLLIVILFFSNISYANQQPDADPRSNSVRTGGQPVIPPDRKEEGLKERLLKNMSGSFALTSNYIFRGLTQTENLPAVQGGLTYTFPFGLYAAVWSSNDKFSNPDVNLEIDTGIGVYRDITADINLDISLYRYHFPSVRAWNYNEWLGQLNFYFLQSNLGYAKNVFNVRHRGFYYDGGINYQFPAKYLFGLQDITLTALVGRYDLPIGFADQAGISYTNCSVTLSKDFKNYNVALQYTNTNQRDFYHEQGGEHFFATLTAAF